MTSLTRLFLVSVLGLAACSVDPRMIGETDMTPREIGTLRGVWEGQASLSFGEKFCPPIYLWEIRVADGNVEGSLLNRDTPNAERSRFSTYLEFDATIRSFVRPSGRDTVIRG